MTAFFDYNRLHADGRIYLYHEFPAHYVYHKKRGERRWTPRQRGFAIGRMYHCSPVAGEKFYLRLLLTVVRGPRSFESLRTVDDQLYATFKAACVARGLLEDDNEWISCFTEASRFSSGSSLRTLFVTALIHGDITAPNLLWEQFRNSICDDLPRRVQQFTDIPLDFDNPHWDYGLFLLARGLADFGRTLISFDLPPPVLRWARIENAPLITAELDYDRTSEARLRDESVQQLNPEQLHCYETIITAITQDPATAHFFVQGPAGTGKTFLYRTLCHYYRARGDIVLCVASSGLAALLLPGGSTSHSRFKIPLDCTSTSTCNIPRNSPVADLIRQTALIIWDEVPMQHKHCFTAVNFSLCDILQNDSLFGGIPIVLGGDFAQTLPIVPQGSRGDQVDASIRQSIFWPQIQILRLSRNMRVLPGPENERFAAWIRTMSYLPSLYGRIQLPLEVEHRFHDIQAFCDYVFPSAGLQHAVQNPDFFVNRAILTLRNDIAGDFNIRILAGLPGHAQQLDSYNTADVNDDTGTHLYTAEFLQALIPSGLPPAQLLLKVGAPIMLIRNLHPKEGLCNGTRLVITSLHRNCIGARILGGAFNGQERLLFRIKLTTKENEYPFVLTRKQFPFRLCFAMTVNKAQGQSLGTVGVDLQISCFSHGQLYVALSRVTDVNRLSVLFAAEEEEYTDNVVYPEVLLPPAIP